MMCVNWVMNLVKMWLIHNIFRQQNTMLIWSTGVLILELCERDKPNSGHTLKSHILIC